jgi:peptide/nickel transport system permease protein
MILGRVFLSIVTLIIVSVFIFSVLEILPGDIASRVLGQFSTQEQRQLFRERMGLNRPAMERYLRWVVNALHGDMGTTYSSERPVVDVVAPKLINTAMLAAYAFALYIPATILLAVASALGRDGPVDHFITGLTLVGLSMPEFLLGTLLLILLAVWLPLFPTMSVFQNTTGFWAYLRVMFLPAVTLAVITSVYGIRMLRDNLIEVLGADYIKMAQLKGLSPWQIAWRHALPNALIPTLNVTALNLAYLIGGVVIVERVFAFPGIGSLLINGVQLLDVPLVEALVLIVSVVYILANLVADVLAMLLTPRLRSL